jgi:hypothetical protein
VKSLSILGLAACAALVTPVLVTSARTKKGSRTEIEIRAIFNFDLAKGIPLVQ